MLRRRTAVLVSLCVIASGILMCWGAAPSVAKTGWVPLNSYPLAEYDQGGTLTVDQGTGEIYVVDLSRQIVDRYLPNGDELTPINGNETPAGSFAFSMPGEVMIDRSGGPNNGDIFVTDNEHNVVDIFNSSRTYIGQLTGSATPAGSFSHPSGLALNSTGDLYVSDLNHKVIDKYDIGISPVSDADYASQLSGTKIKTPGSIAFDGSDNLYLSNYGKNYSKFNSAGTFLSIIGPVGGGPQVDVDPTHRLAFFVGQSALEVTDLSGATLFQITLYSGTSGFVEDHTSQRVYSMSTPYWSVNTPVFHIPEASTGTASGVTGNAATVSGTVNADEGSNTTCHFEYRGENSFRRHTVPCAPAGPFSDSADHAVTANLSGLQDNTTYHFDLTASNENGGDTGQDVTFTTPVAVHDLFTEGAENVTATGATLKGSFTGNGDDTHYYFEWGINTAYGNVTATPPGLDAGTDTGTVQLSAPVSGLEPATTYHFRVVASNSVGSSIGNDQEFTTPFTAPQVSVVASSVHSDSAEFQAGVNPRGLETTYQFEYGLADCESNPCTSTPVGNAGAGSSTKNFGIRIEGVTPDTTYHFRLVAENASGTVSTPDQTFTSFPRLVLENDPCSNSQVRKQTHAAQLLDCRAYELVSAASAGGYDVESDLVPGQDPFEGYPLATEPPRVLYSVHSGSIPGTGTPTNFSRDPYVATRTSSGWETAYVGLPAEGLAANSEPFGSPVAAADSSLGSFAFGGEGLCSPCFPDGSTGVPIRLPAGTLVQGMAGSLNPGPSAAPAGLVVKPFSSDGTRFVFGSTSKFESDGNNNGDISIYDRNLSTGDTHVVSKTPGGATMTGSGIAELDISTDGSRVLIGQKVATDAEGNALYHLYMNVGDSGQTIDLTPGAANGVIYAGMSADGTKVYFSSTNKLTADDHDTSADVYRADVSAVSALLTRVSTGSGSTGDTDSCNPTSGWNSASGGANCDAVVIAGRGGVGASDGSLYFLSPERLDGPTNGTQNAPNLYIDRPGGSPHFVATLETSDPAVVHAIEQASTHSWGDFQVAPSGDFAAFVSTGSLTEFHSAGFSEVFRYDDGSQALDCVSCATTNVIPTSAATLPPNGLGLSNDGRVFFTSGEALAPGDNNGSTRDAYEWEEGTTDLISSGVSQDDSGIFSVSADGTDANFFTRETLVGTDLNGRLMKIYDARHLGGFLLNPPRVPCQASDECHGPGSQAAGPPPIGTYKGKGGNIKKKRGHKHHHHHRRSRHHHRGGGK